ncbi:MAG: hypothetical protein COX14_01185 [Chloroflexi bacterium CG23_combo_of_CG06-09_8_20_14_all_45_10]|nr:MAG: hypothetical protein COX14_01185 [Chloroflexi bacterium CG23_combo_of_CG06-09_8_20_14_all_45_10]
MGITMTNGQEELWKVEAIVEPQVEYEKIKNKIGIADFRIGEDELVTFEKQLENKTQLSVTVLCNDRRKVHDRAEFLTKAFLGLLGLESHCRFNFELGVAHSAKAKP